MSKLTKLIIGAIAAVVVLVVVAVALFILTRDEAPEAVDLETTVARIEAAEAAGEGTEQPPGTESTDGGADEPTATGAAEDAGDAGATSSTGSDDVSAAGADETAVNDSASDSNSAETGEETAPADQTADTSGGLAGVWTLQVAENPGDLQGEPTVSFAGFRVNEVLNNIGDFTAVGRTAKVSGSIELSDTSLVSATVEVQMSTLRTDNNFRDGRMYQALNTNEFPVAVFALVEPVELPAGMADGEPFSGTTEGDLTIRGVTNRATFDLQAQLVGDRIVAVGSSAVVFSNYGVTAPTAPIVVSVEDNGIMEFQLIFTR